MAKQRKGFTLVETLIVSIMVAALIGALTLIFQVMAAGWSGHGGRIGMATAVNRAVVSITETLRGAKEMASPNAGEIRFTLDGAAYYVYYLYDQGGLCQVRKTVLSGGIGGTFVSGSGDIIARDILPSPDTDMSCLGRVATIDLSMRRMSSVVRSATKVAARNI